METGVLSNFPAIAGWMLVLWMTLIGAAVGSFLNVVVYRLPRGMSLIEPPSHCPTCRRRIRWYDNVPVLSWLVLRGRCRDCRAKISLRYPLVEAATAALFGGLLAVELHWPNQVYQPEVQLLEGVRIVASNMTLLYIAYLYHLLLLCTLFSAGLMEWNGCLPPRKLFYPVMLIGILLPLWQTQLRPPVLWPFHSERLVSPVEGLVGLAAGAILGGLAGWLFWRLQRKSSSPATTSEKPPKAISAVAAGLFCVGVCLGWQAAVLVNAIAGLLYTIAMPLRGFRLQKARSPVGLLLALAALGCLIAWARLAPAAGL